jgi:hypothetical protein
MNARYVALGLLAAAALLFAGVTLPAWREAGAAQDEYQRQHQQLRAARTRARRADPQPSAGPARGAGGALREARRKVLAIVDRAPVNGVTLDCQPGRTGEAALVRLAAEGAYFDLSRLAGRLSGAETGLVLSAFRLLPTQTSNLRLELEAAALPEGP